MIPFRSTLSNKFNPANSYNPFSAKVGRPGGMVGNPFGVNMQIPGIPQQPPIVQPQNQFNMNPTQPLTPAPEPPSINGPLDFASEYAKASGNRPNRLAYQQAVEQGEPEIKRGKWAKLGAMIAAAGGSMGYGNQPGGAQAGANLGLSSYYEPQRRASDKYDKRVKGLANLAQFEESDKANELRALEIKHGDYWKEREASRADKSAATSDKIAEAQIANMALDNMIAIVEEGNTFLYDKASGKKTFVGKTGRTTPESIKDAADIITAQRTAAAPFEKQEQELRNKGALDVANANNTGREVKTLSPAEQQTQAWNDIQREFATNPKLQGKNPQDYVSLITGPDGNQILTVKPSITESWGGWKKTPDDEATASIKTEINRVIGESMARTTRGGGTTRNTGSPNTSTTSTAAKTPASPTDAAAALANAPKSVEEVAAITEGNPAGTVAMFDTQSGQYFKVTPEEAKGMAADPEFAHVKIAFDPTSSVAPVSPVIAPKTIPDENANASEMAAIGALGQRQTEADARALAASKMGFSQQPPMQPAGPPITPPPMPNIPMARPAPINPAGRKLMPDTMARGHALTPTGPAPGPAPIPPPNMPPMMRAPNAPPVQPPIKPPVQPPVNPIQLGQPAGMPNIPMARTPPNIAPAAPPPNIAPSPAGLAGLPGEVPLPPPGRVPENPISLAPAAKGPLVAPTQLYAPGEPATKESVSHFRGLAEDVRQRMKEATGYNVKFISKKRSPEEQKKLFNIGRGAGDKRDIVTNADGTIKKSQHQADEAVDVAFVDPKGKTVKLDYKKNKKLYDTFGKIAEELGLTWGGRWKSPFDPGHIQLRPIENLDKPKPTGTR